MFQYSVFTRFFIKQIGDDKCSKILFSKHKNFLSGIVVLFLRQSPYLCIDTTGWQYRYVSVALCIDTDCIVPALVKFGQIHSGLSIEIEVTWPNLVRLVFKHSDLFIAQIWGQNVRLMRGSSHAKRIMPWILVLGWYFIVTNEHSTI